jgi:hypothetical protein
MNKGTLAKGILAGWVALATGCQGVTVDLEGNLAESASGLEARMSGEWRLTGFGCTGGVTETPPAGGTMTLTFSGPAMELVSREEAPLVSSGGECQRTEGHGVEYLYGDSVRLAVGPGVCSPSPCGSGSWILASDCGSSGGQVDDMTVEFSNGEQTMTLLMPGSCGSNGSGFYTLAR